MSTLRENIAAIVMEVLEASDPMRLEYGTVESVSPLSVRIDQKRAYGSDFIIVPAHLRDIGVEAEIELTADEATHTHEITPKSDEGAAPPDEEQEYELSEESHSHIVKGVLSFTLPLGIKQGDKVALLRKQGGKDYVVLGVIP